MADGAATRKLEAVVVGAEPDGAGVVIRYATVRGTPTELEDRVSLGVRGDLASVHGVGRVLRVLRAGRVKGPSDPYALGDDPDSTASLLRQCRGALVTLHVARRFERMLTIWTEEGISRIDRVLDVTEDAAGLSVRRRGGDSALRIPRQSLIRFVVSTREHPEIISVEVSTKVSLR
jgi:hypothetical protein